MKKLVAALGLVVLGSALSFPAFAGGKCGSNVGRNTSTSNTNSQPSGNSSQGAGVPH